MLDRRSIPIKLALAVGIPVVASLLFAVLALRTVEQVRIGGRQYNEVAKANDLKADILPPPFYIVEAFLTVEQMVDTPDEATYLQQKAKLDSLHQQYEAAHQRWLDNLDPGAPDEAQIRRLLTDEGYQPASQFFALVQSDFYPAMESNLRSTDRRAARTVVTDKLAPLYDQHRASVVAAVPLIDTRVASLEGSATANADRGYTLLLVALAGLTALALALAALVARAIVGPIRRLTRAADEVATTLDSADLEQEAPDLEPISLDSSRELNQAADSFNTLIGTTTDLLDRHARMRRNLGEIFQNLGRRNHGLLTRSLQVITELEQHETDSATLDRLFRLDHLATRMRRNAENLLVLAGSQSARPAERQAGINEIIRSALSEIEAYTRVERPELEPVDVKPGAVADVTHLLAELIENATNFSPPECRVRVMGDFVDDGYAVTVVDEGLGMRDDAIEEANQRINRQTSLDLTPTRTLGLYVVGRLAQRHGIRVRLLEGSLRGTVAKVVLPAALLAEPRAEVPEPVGADRLRYAAPAGYAAPTGYRPDRYPADPYPVDRYAMTAGAMTAGAMAGGAMAGGVTADHYPSGHRSAGYAPTGPNPPVHTGPAGTDPEVGAASRSPLVGSRRVRTDPEHRSSGLPPMPPVSRPEVPPPVSPVSRSEPAIAPPVRPDPAIAPPSRPEPSAAAPPSVLPAPGSPAGGVEERNGMRRRVRGAQLPQTQLTGLGQPAPARGSGPDGDEPERSDALRLQRDSLRNFQQAVDQGTRDGRSAGGGDS